MTSKSPYFGMSLSGNPTFSGKSPTSPSATTPVATRPRAKEIKHREPPFEFTFIPELFNLSSDFVYPLASKTESHPELKSAPESHPTTPLLTPSLPAATPSTPPVLPTPALTASISPADAPYIPSSRTGASTSANAAPTILGHPSSSSASSVSAAPTGPAALLASLPQHIQDDTSNPVISLIKVGTQLITRRQQLRNAERLLSQQAGGFLSVLQREEKRGQLLSGIVQNVRQTRKYLLSRISNPRWEIAHHYHTTALEHSLGRKQPNVIEVAEMLPGHLAIYAMARRTTLSQKVLIYFLNRAKKTRTTASERIKTTYAKLKSCRQSGKEVDASLAAVKKTAREVKEGLLLGLLKPITDNVAHSSDPHGALSPSESVDDDTIAETTLSPTNSTISTTNSTLSSDIDATAILSNALDALLTMLASEESANGLGLSGVGIGMGAGGASGNRQGVRARFLQSLNIAPGAMDDVNIDFIEGTTATATTSGNNPAAATANGDVANVQAMLTDIEKEMQRRITTGETAGATEKGFYSDVTTNEALVAEEGYRSTATLMKVLPRPIQYDESVEDNESKLLVSGATNEEEEEVLRRQREKEEEEGTPSSLESEHSLERKSSQGDDDLTESADSENRDNSGFGEDVDTAVDSAVHAELQDVAQLLASIEHITSKTKRAQNNTKNDKKHHSKGDKKADSSTAAQTDHAQEGKPESDGTDSETSKKSENASGKETSTPISEAQIPDPASPTIPLSSQTKSASSPSNAAAATNTTPPSSGPQQPSSGPQQLRVYSLARSQQQSQSAAAGNTGSPVLSAETGDSTSAPRSLPQGQSPRQGPSLFSSLSSSSLQQGQSPRQATSFLSSVQQGQSPRQPSTLLSSLHLAQGQSPKQPASILSSLSSYGGSSFAFGQGQSPRQVTRSASGGASVVNGVTTTFDANSLVNTVVLPSSSAIPTNDGKSSGSENPVKSNLSKALSSSKHSNHNVTSPNPAKTATNSSTYPGVAQKSNTINSSLIVSEENVLPAPKAAVSGLSSMLRKTHLSPKEEESVLLGSLGLNGSGGVGSPRTSHLTSQLSAQMGASAQTDSPNTSPSAVNGSIVSSPSSTTSEKSSAYADTSRVENTSPIPAGGTTHTVPLSGASISLGALNTTANATNTASGAPTIVTNGPTRVIPSKSAAFSSIHGSNSSIPATTITLGMGSLSAGLHSVGVTASHSTTGANANSSGLSSGLSSTGLARHRLAAGKSSIITISGHSGLGSPTPSTSSTNVVAPQNNVSNADPATKNP